MNMGDNNNRGGLPPGFRFYPTDEELIVHFLHCKSGLLPCHPDVIPDLHLLTCDPWDLQGKALSEGRKWYHYSRRTTQLRTSQSGYWKPTGLDEPIISSCDSKLIGMKQYFVFHVFGNGEDGDGDDNSESWTNWVMHEYRLPDVASSNTTRSSKRRGSSKQVYSDRVICKVYERTGGDDGGDDEEIELSCLDEVFLSVDDLDEISLPS